MKNSTKIIMLGICLFAFVTSCKKDEVRGKVGFTTSATGTANESAGQQDITVSAGIKVNTPVTISFALSGEAALNGNYQLVTPSPITVAAGQSTATLSFIIIDNKNIEKYTDFSVILTITEVTGYTLAATDAKEFKFTITDNDATPTSGMQVDLGWNLGTGEDIDQADLDIYLTYNLVFDEEGGGGVIDWTTSEDIYSTEASGFESYVIDVEQSDEEYYVAVVYYEGNVQAPFTLGYSSTSTGFDSATGTFASDEAGQVLFYGPIYKEGSDFSFDRAQAPRFVKGHLTPEQMKVFQNRHNTQGK